MTLNKDKWFLMDSLNEESKKNIFEMFFRATKEEYPDLTITNTGDGTLISRHPETEEKEE